MSTCRQTLSFLSSSVIWPDQSGASGGGGSGRKYQCKMCPQVRRKNQVNIRFSTVQYENAFHNFTFCPLETLLSLFVCVGGSSRLFPLSPVVSLVFSLPSPVVFLQIRTLNRSFHNGRRHARTAGRERSHITALSLPPGSMCEANRATPPTDFSSGERCQRAPTSPMLFLCPA